MDHGWIRVTAECCCWRGPTDDPCRSRTLMPTQWAHSVFFGDKGELPVIERDMALLGVGRSIVLSIALFGMWNEPWLPLILVASALAAPKILSGVRGLAFRLIGGKE